MVNKFPYVSGVDKLLQQDLQRGQPEEMVVGVGGACVAVGHHCAL